MKKITHYLKDIALPVVVYGALTGVIVGVFVFLFKLAAEFISEKSVEIYEAAHGNVLIAVAVVCGAVAIAVVMSLVQKFVPESRGAGIPRSEGVLRSVLTFRWLRTGIAVVANTLMSLLAGLPVDCEGPAVLVGVSIGDGASRLPLSHDSWRRYVMTGGGAAGFAVATNAPLTGFLFAVEETHKRFTPLIILMSASAILFAMTSANVCATIFHVDFNLPLFNFGKTVAERSALVAPMQLSDLWMTLVIGVVVAVGCCLYNLTVFSVGQTKFGKKIPRWVRLAVVFGVTALVGVMAFGNFRGTDALFSGYGLIESVARREKTVQILFAVLAVRFVLITFTNGSDATGGVSIPMLSIGAVMGALLAELFVAMGADSSLYATIVVISMSAFMGACTRAPISALVFAVESTWCFNNLFYAAVAVFTSFFICEMLHVEPLYDVMLDRMTEAQNEGKTSKIIDVTYVVREKAFAVGKSVRDILWPATTKVNEIVKNNVGRLDDDGEKKIEVGDSVSVLVQTYDEQSALTELDNIFGKQQ